MDLKNLKIEDLSIEEKIGQMLMYAFHGQEFNEQLKTQLDKFHVGGVIHFAHNIKDPIQVTELNKNIIDYAKIPPFIGVDQEGGVVQRIIKGVTPFPSAMALSASQNDITELCYNVGKNLHNMNYSMVFAPVADINNNPLNPVINSRSYSDNPDVVGQYIIEAYRGFDKANIMPFLKHFPGHGDTNVDSHVGLPIVNKTKEELHNLELVPFTKAINDGCPGVMIAHILYPAYDTKYPSTLSKPIVSGLLREELGYKGLIITDSLTMAAVYNNYTKREIVKMCVNAGIDIMMFCGKATLEEQEEIYNAFIDLVKTGEISIDRINESVNRIIEYKKKYCDKIYDKYEYPSLDAINLGKKLSYESITLIKDNKLDINKKTLVIFPRIKVFSLVDNANNEYVSLANLLKKNCCDASEVIISDEDQKLDEINKIKDDYEQIIFATYNVRANDYQVKVYNELPKDKLTVVAMRSPYDAMYLDDLQGYICIYEATELALNSLCEAIKNGSYIGKLPIKLNIK